MPDFLLKHPRFWGDLFIAAAVIGSNVGSAWAGIQYGVMTREPFDPFAYSVPPNFGFEIMAWSVYPLAIALLVLGVYLRSRSKEP